MLNNIHFYNRSIRKIVVAFGTIFNDIQLVRYTKDGITAKEIFKVPLSYGPKEKYLTRITSDPNLTKSVSSVIPRISFELTGLSYDPERKRQSAYQNMAVGPNYTVKTQYNPIPYNFDFSLSIYVRNTEDGTQIVEQILPFFTPDFTLSVDFIPELNQKYDLPIMLNDISNETTYEGDFLSTRMIIWTLSFTVKGYIWPPVKVAANGLIRSVNTNFNLVSTDLSNLAISSNRIIEQQHVYVDYANGSNYFADNEVVRVEDDIRTFGTLYYFSNNSTGLLVLSEMNGIIKTGDVLVGDYSRAKYTVTDVNLKPTGTVTIRITPNPIDANPDDDYGFTEEIIENV